MNPGLVVKLRPTGPWRIGPDSGARNRVDLIYHSDSVYSAVTSAMARLGSLDEWLDATARSSAPAVCFSSCFPFLDEIGFVAPPRTIWPPKSPALTSSRVRWKSARFVPLGIVQAILAGQTLDDNHWTVDGVSGCLAPAGRPGPFRTSVRWSAAVDRLTGAAERHSTACIEFRPGSGLWAIVSFSGGAAHERWASPVKAAFRLLADTGFGGERSRGWGRTESPEFVDGMLPDMILGPSGAAGGPRTRGQGPGAGQEERGGVLAGGSTPGGPAAAGDGTSGQAPGAGEETRGEMLADPSTRAGAAAAEDAGASDQANTGAGGHAPGAEARGEVLEAGSTPAGAAAAEDAGASDQANTGAEGRAPAAGEEVRGEVLEAGSTPAGAAAAEDAGASDQANTGAEGQAPAAEARGEVLEAGSTPAGAAAAEDAGTSGQANTVAEDQAPGAGEEARGEALAAGSTPGGAAAAEDTSAGGQRPGTGEEGHDEGFAAGSTPAGPATADDASAELSASSGLGRPVPEPPPVEEPPQGEPPVTEPPGEPSPSNPPEHPAVPERATGDEGLTVSPEPDGPATTEDATAELRAPASIAALSAPSTASEPGPEAQLVEEAPKVEASVSVDQAPGPRAAAPGQARPPALDQATPHWLLSLFTPAATDSIDWARGNYTLLARGGRIDSPAGSGELKKQLSMLAEGSVVYAASAPCGSAPDVAPDGFAHPVFRAGFALSIPLPEVS